MEMRGVSKRSAFIIGKDGKVHYAEILENAGEEPDYKAIQKCLSFLN
jgi:peroxiredoxin